VTSGSEPFDPKWTPVPNVVAHAETGVPFFVTPAPAVEA
jgi:hypothetical protein